MWHGPRACFTLSFAPCAHMRAWAVLTGSTRPKCASCHSRNVRVLIYTNFIFSAAFVANNKGTGRIRQGPSNIANILYDCASNELLIFIKTLNFNTLLLIIVWFHNISRADPRRAKVCKNKIKTLHEL